MNKNHIFVDTNVLIGAYAQKQDDIQCLQYLYRLTGKKLYISSLSIAQLVSVFQKKKSNFEIKEIIKRILAKFVIISFSRSDIETVLEYNNFDVEDTIQYVISKKMQCGYFITNNVKDYRSFVGISVFKPKQVRTIVLD